MRCRCALLFAVIVLLAARAEAANIVDVMRVGDGEVRVMDLVEFDVTLDRSYANPFDPAVISVHATTLSPETIETGGFWFQDCAAGIENGYEVVTPKGDPSFRVRLRPRTAGHWSVAIDANDDAGTATREVSFDVVPGSSPGPGFVGIDPADGTRMVRGGKPYVPFGANVDWVLATGVTGFEQFFERLATHGLNWTRVWMTHFDGTALEWKAGGDDGAYAGLGTYNLKAAWRLDRVLELAEERGIALQLVLHQHSQFECGQWSSWDENPWNAANGGPLAKSADFFADPDVIAGMDAKLRYVVARYAHSPALLAWELMNEVDLVNGLKPAAANAWMRGRAAIIRDLDPYDHLVTTSYAAPGVEGTDQDWADPAYDLVQLHSYMDAYWDVLPMAAANLLTFAKPIVLAEFGIDSQGVLMMQDTKGVHLVNGTLLGSMLGFAGGAMSWWWDGWLEPYGLWPAIGNVAKAVLLAGGPWKGATRLPYAGNGIRILEAGAGDDFVLWLHADASEWNTPDDPSAGLGGVSLTDHPSCLSGSVEVTCFDPWTGTASQDEAACVPGVDSQGAPGIAYSFSRDLLVRVRCPGSVAIDETTGTPDESATDAAPDPAATDTAPSADGAPDIEDVVLPPPSYGGGCSARF
jgi:hypothetical protein